MAVPFETFTRPIILGIVGDSAAGKTTLSRGIARFWALSVYQCSALTTITAIIGDNARSWGITPLNPACNYLDIMAQQLRLLRAGEPILKPRYDHKLGEFGAPDYIVPQHFLIVEGLLGMYRQEMRNSYSVCVYLDPPEELRYRWKVWRDSTSVATRSKKFCASSLCVNIIRQLISAPSVIMQML